MGVCLDRDSVVESECSSLHDVSMPTSSTSRLATINNTRNSNSHRKSVGDSKKQVGNLANGQKKLEKQDTRPTPTSEEEPIHLSTKVGEEPGALVEKPSVLTVNGGVSSVGIQVTSDSLTESGNVKDSAECCPSDDAGINQSVELTASSEMVDEKGIVEVSSDAKSNNQTLKDKEMPVGSLSEPATETSTMPPLSSTVSHSPTTDDKCPPAKSAETSLDQAVELEPSSPKTAETEELVRAVPPAANHGLVGTHQTVSTSSFTMSKLPELTKPAPDFCGQAVVDGQFKEIKLADYKGKYLVLFFYPLDFTFVCPTEIISFSEKAEDFRKINCEVVACSTDSQFSHFAWINTPRKQGGLGSMNIPLLADKTGQIAKDYGCYKEDEGIAFRGLYIIDDKGRLRQITINDLPVGRSVEETLRLVQAFQFTDKYGEVCPANWKPGDKTMKPDTNASKEYFSQAH